MEKRHPGKTQAEAAEVIQDFLRELCPNMHLVFVEHNARSIIARLAQKSLLIYHIDEVEDK